MTNFIIHIMPKIDRNINPVSNAIKVDEINQATEKNTEETQMKPKVTDGYHFRDDLPSNDVSIEPELNPTTTKPLQKLSEIEKAEDNVIADKLTSRKNYQYKIFSEDYQDKLMDEIFIV